jgi:DNA polymerase-3 subunit epsilon
MVTTYAVIDFETTGLSPAQGARPTEIAVVLVNDGGIVDRYQSLMNPGVPIPSFIQSLTGISNAMVRKAPGVQQVMAEAADFVGEHPLVAHNASFDRTFWHASLPRTAGREKYIFTCSLLLARRIFPRAPNHKLATLVRVLDLPITGRFHRALADAEATAHLLLRLQQELLTRYGLESVSNALLLDIQGRARQQLEACIRRYRADDGMAARGEG